MMIPATEPKKPQNPAINQDQDSENGGETYGNEPPVKDPKKNPRDPDKYEMIH